MITAIKKVTKYVVDTLDVDAEPDSTVKIDLSPEDVDSESTVEEEGEGPGADIFTI